MLATAVWTALKDAIAATGDGKTAVRLDAPATPERVLAAIATLEDHRVYLDGGDRWTYAWTAAWP